MEKEHLHLLIDEEIYLIKGESNLRQETSGTEQATDNEELEVLNEVEIEESKVSESHRDEKKEEQQSRTETVESRESPAAPIQQQEKEVTHDANEKPPSTEPKLETQDSTKYVFFHNTDQSAELDLLHKIISACKLDTADLKVLKVGQDASFEKAVVFTRSGPSYYVSTQHERGIVMYSQPLAILMSSKEEKGKLWGALQEFVK